MTDFKDSLRYEVVSAEGVTLGSYGTRSEAINHHEARFTPLAIYEVRYTVVNLLVPKDDKAPDGHRLDAPDS